MKKNKLIQIILFSLLVAAITLLVFQNYRFEKIKKQNIQLLNGTELKLTEADSVEDFDRFLYNFCLDSMFQINRIKFPIKLSYRVDFEDYNAPLLDTVLPLKNWNHDDLFYNQQTQVQIFDNFGGTLRNTKERIVNFRGVENGRNLAYFFEADQGKWFMIKIVNKGD